MEKVRSGALESTKRSRRTIGRRSRTVLGVEEAAAGACRRQGAAGGAGGAAGGAGIGEEGSSFGAGGGAEQCGGRPPGSGLCAATVVWQKMIRRAFVGRDSVISAWLQLLANQTVFRPERKERQTLPRLTRWRSLVNREL